MGKAFNKPPDDEDLFTPLNYFQFFWKDSFMSFWLSKPTYTACRKLIKV